MEKCPYSKKSEKELVEVSKTSHKVNDINNFEADILSVNSSRNPTEINEVSDNDSKFNDSTKKCPYNKNSKIDSNFKQEIPINSKSNKDSKVINGGCPFKEDIKENQDTMEDSDDENQQGGCPVMNNKKSDVVNKHFEETWELPFYGPFDFMFEMTGGLAQTEYLEKTKELRNYPRHLLQTLFNQNDEKLNKVRVREFPMVFFVYDDIKIKGNKYYKKKKYKEALDYYFYVSKKFISLIQHFDG